jgi:type IV pilus biogenesis protein CpaD/CtpE
MKTAIAYTVAAIAVAAMLSACSDTLPLNQPDGFGNAVRHNIEAQVVNPNPKPESGPIPMNGNRAGIAMQRYESDKVKEPKSMSTSGINVLGGGTQ